MADAKEELIRIDAQGVAHPIGVVASQRMRRHEGTYRALPSPDHVVLLRFTGDDGRVDPEDGATVRLAGEIAAQGTICDILALLAQAGWRGQLTVHSGPVLRKVFIDSGNVLGVKSSELEERLGRVLYRYGHIQEEDLAKIESQAAQGRRFGEAALDLGLVTREGLYAAFREQITEVVIAAMRVADGTFFFLDGFDEAELPSRQAVSLNSMLMEGVTRMDEMSYFAEKIPSMDHIPAALPNTVPPPAELSSVLRFVDGESNLREIGRKSGLGEFETSKKIYSLLQSKHVQLQPPQGGAFEPGLVAAANQVLQACFRHAEAAGRTSDLRQSLESFVVGAGPLFDVLLRGAGPNEAGLLDVDKVLANLPRVVQGGGADQTLGRLLHEFVSFALFSVGSAVGRERENELQRECDSDIGILRLYA
jgi:Domain of unknown function (DUF4388)